MKESISTYTTFYPLGRVKLYCFAVRVVVIKRFTGSVKVS